METGWSTITAFAQCLELRLKVLWDTGSASCDWVSWPSERVLTMWRKDKRRPLISYRPSLPTGGMGLLLMVEPRLWSWSTKYKQHTDASHCIRRYVIQMLDKKILFFFNPCMPGDSKQSKSSSGTWDSTKKNTSQILYVVWLVWWFISSTKFSRQHLHWREVAEKRKTKRFLASNVTEGQIVPLAKHWHVLV